MNGNVINIDLSKCKVVDFKVVSNNNKDQFEHEVGYQVSSGFIPSGMMIVDSTGVFHIPMIKVEEKRRGFFR